METEALKRLNEIQEDREKMINLIAYNIGISRGYTTDRQFDKLEAKYRTILISCRNKLLSR